MAANAPPIKCPLVPAATGKLIIWAAKIKTATSPAIGAVWLSSEPLVFFRLTATAPATRTPAPMETGALISPSGICMKTPYCELFAIRLTQKPETGTFWAVSSRNLEFCDSALHS